jgi:hypothetical protein
METLKNLSHNSQRRFRQQENLRSHRRENSKYHKLAKIVGPLNSGLCSSLSLFRS